MVEFVKKTLAIKDCTLDATYSDLYDGTNPYLKVGGIIEPKKALLRFQVADKPTYGDATLAGGELGLYATGLNLGNTSSYPTYNIYKLKTSPDGVDWGSEGRIRTITRGKQVIGLGNSATQVSGWTAYTADNSVKVESHELETGDAVWWSPVTSVYDDCNIQPLVPEQVYYAIKIDRDNFKFATSISNAIEDIAVTLSSTEAEHTPNARTAQGGPWGYIRSEKYKQDIHVVSAVADNSVPQIAENFNGKEYRETDLEFETVQRTVTRMTDPYLDDSGIDALVDNKETGIQGKEGKGKWLKFGTLGNESHDNLAKWYGNGKERGDDAFAIRLTSNQTDADGGGWWRTVKDAGKWGGGHDYVKKGDSNVKFETESIAGAEPYGDEVTPQNSMFHTVRGAAEFQEAGQNDGDNEIQATGAIRFSTKKKLTGGQSCNIYQFWKDGGLGVTYPSNNVDDNNNDRQECLMLYKGLPFPSKMSTNIGQNLHGHGQYPFGNSGASGSNKDEDNKDMGQDMCVTMAVNFNKLEKAYSIAESGRGGANLDDVTLRRAFTVVYANSAPVKGEQLFNYIDRLAGDNQTHDDNDGLQWCSFSLVNTDIGIRVITGDFLAFDTTNLDLYKDSMTNGGESETNQLLNSTLMEEGEWYNIKTFFPSANAESGALVIEDRDGNQVQQRVADPTAVTAKAIPLYNVNRKNAGGAAVDAANVPDPWYGGGASTPASYKWFQHMSIWVTNTLSGFEPSIYQGIDWMADYEDRDTCNDIFIDSISVDGVNLDHENATVGQNGTRSKIFISGGKKYNSSNETDPTMGRFDFNTGVAFHKDERVKGSHTYLSLGFEDPSQILSNHRREKSWRYLFWHGFQSANISADGKLGWTADDTLPATTYAATGDDHSQRWFTPLPDNTYTSGGDSSADPRRTLDAGTPYTYYDTGTQLAPAIRTWYSDNHVSLGAQCSWEVLDARDLWYSRTKDADTDGHIGAKQPMFTTCPSIGATFDGVSGVGSKLITLTAGPNNYTNHADLSNGVFWNSGQSVVYYNNDFASCANVLSANGQFTDSPTVYYWQRVSDKTGYLHTSYAEALAEATSTRVGITDGGAGQHVLYTADYYNNRKYFVDGFTSKGLSRFILEPYGGSDGAIAGTTAFVSGKHPSTAMYLPVKANGTTDDDGTSLADATAANLKLTKRENVYCAAKILEVKKPITKGSAVCRVDSTTPLRSVEGTTYRAWLAGQAHDNDFYASGLSVEITGPEEIIIHDWDGTANDGQPMTSTDGPHTAAGTGLCRLWIGPEKYWVGFVIRNESGDSSTTSKLLPLKTYNSVSVVAPFDTGSSASELEMTYGGTTEYQAWGTPGATYNESTYNADNVSGIRGAYVNQWKPSVNTDPNQTIFDLADFGFGGPTEDKDSLGGENGIIGGYAGKFIPQTTQVNRVKMPKLFSAGSNQQVEGDYLDIMLQQETLSSDAVMTMASTDNGAYPKPFLLTTFEDKLPAPPSNFKISPYEKDAFYPEYQWEASDADLWYGLIMVDEVPINNQYHRSLIHIPFDEDLRPHAIRYDDTKGWEYYKTSSPLIYGYRYSNTEKYPSGVHAGNSLASSGLEKVNAAAFKGYDNVEGLAGNCKNFQIKTSTVSTTNDTFTSMYNDSNTIVHTTITPDAVKPGQLVTGAGVPDGAYVATVTSATSFTIAGATINNFNSGKTSGDLDVASGTHSVEITTLSSDATITCAAAPICLGEELTIEGDRYFVATITTGTEGSNVSEFELDRVCTAAASTYTVDFATDLSINWTYNAVAGTLTHGNNVNNRFRGIVATTLHDRILLKNQTSAIQNGVYVITQIGNGSVPIILTRDTSMDASADFINSIVFINDGTNLEGGNSWACTVASDFTLGTDNITYEDANTLTLKDAGYAEFNFDTTASSSDFSYPIDEMSVVVHVSPTSWASSTHPQRYICSFNEPNDLTATKDSWGIYLDENGKVNAYVAGIDAANTSTHPTAKIINLQSTTKLPIDGTPTSIILTVDTQIHSANVKLLINGRLEDQTGLRKTTGTANNWQTDADGLGGEAIFYDTDGTENLFIGAKSSTVTGGVNIGIYGFEGRIEEFVWYDKVIYPVVPTAGKMLLEKPLSELAEGDSASSKSYVSRLFVKDYHNIRGKTSGEVAASSQIVFKKAAFTLKTN